MRTRIPVGGLLSLVAACSGVQAETGVEAIGALDRADSAFQREVKDARLELLKEFERAIRAYSRSGQLLKAEAVREERREFLRSFGEDTSPRDQKPVKLSPAEMDVYAGRYLLPSNALLEIRREGDGLAAFSQGTRTELIPIGNHRFLGRGRPELGRFLMRAEGTAGDLLISGMRESARRLREEEWDIVRIRAFVGHRAHLILRGKTAQWFHQRGNAPGRLPKAVKPTIINGTAWQPVWPDVPNWHNREGFCYSDTFTQVDPPLPAEEGPTHVVHTEGSGRLFVLQERAAANGYTQIIGFEGNGGQGNEYEIELWVPKKGTRSEGGGTADGQPAAATVPKEGLLAHYPLGGDAKDASGNGHHGQFNGPTAAADRFERSDAASYFDGNSYVEISPPPKREAGVPMSVSLWANYDDRPGGDDYSQGLFAQDDGRDGGPHRVYQLSGFRGRIVQHLFDWQKDLFAKEEVVPDTWYHIVTVYDGKTHRLYIDGQVQDAMSGGLAASLEQPFHIGTKNPRERHFHFRGRIDDVRIYGRSLERGEIRALYDEDGYGRLPLHEAASTGKVNAVRQLLKAQSEVDVRDRSGRAPLYLACQGGHVDVAQLLLAQDADVSLSAPNGNTALHAAVTAGSEELVELLLDRGAEANPRNHQRKTPMHLACALGRLATVKILMKRGGDIHGGDAAGYTPLHRAAMYDRIEVAKLLLESNVDVFAKDKEGETALRRAVAMGRARCAELLGKMP